MFGLSEDIIKGALSLGAGLFNCNGIVNLDQIPNNIMVQTALSMLRQYIH